MATEGTQILALEWMFPAGIQEGKQIGFARARSAHFGQPSMTCAHSNLGYREIFAEAFNDLVTNYIAQSQSTP